MLNPLILDDLNYPEAKQPTLTILHYSSVAKNYVAYGLTKHGVFMHPFLSVATRAQQTTSVRLPSTPLFLTIGTTDATAKRGETYALAKIEYGGSVSDVLIQGYIHAGHDLSWPGGRHELAMEGVGNFRVITGTDPAANTEISETVPDNALWRLHHFNAELVTDANAANRLVQFYIDDGTTQFLLIPAAPTHVASTTKRYLFGQYGYQMAADIGGLVVTSIPTLVLPAGYRIATNVVSRQATDNWGAPVLFVEEWLVE